MTAPVDKQKFARTLREGTQTPSARWWILRSVLESSVSFLLSFGLLWGFGVEPVLGVRVAVGAAIALMSARFALWAAVNLLGACTLILVATVMPEPPSDSSDDAGGS